MPELLYSTVIEQAGWVAAGEISARELVEHSIARIDALNPVLNAFAHVFTEEARAHADALDAERAAGALRGPLHGVPIAIKEENDVAGIPTRFGSSAFTTPATADSAVVQRLRDAGAIIVGTTRMPEFGIWPFTESDSFGWTRNPWNTGRSTAGSSGGTAAAIASGMVAAGIGGDGGGSIRLPASWCGLFGLKPQRGRVSLAPNTDLWRALGVIGPLTRSVADSALIHDVIGGAASADRFSAEALPAPMLRSATEPLDRPLRIMVSLKNPMGGQAADPDTASAVRRTADLLRGLGHEVIEADPDYPRLALPFQVQLAAGISDEAARADHPELLERRTRAMLRLARPLSRFGAWAERAAAERGEPFLTRLFGGVDLLITPTTPTAALPVGQLDGAGAIAAVQKAGPVSSFTSVWNALGNPAAAVPAGFTDAGLPLSVQVIGPRNDEPTVLALSAQLESARPWADRRPPLAEANAG
ncbi:amidase [Microbacterium sp. cx-59]|uniref:amidase n=1 Tax=Microbacterium sp. cx-59 TaxID=2891207 RepID=UPI001E5D49E3|nr:amidase [Microbacterium sp. cx-59]MCC4908875.1 amidase [Microbacterium sp. cx-59]